jgi:hypothetical protein
MVNPSSAFFRACTCSDYRDAELAFARWLLELDWNDTLVVAADLTPEAAARGLAALEAGMDAELVQQNSEALQTLVQALTARAHDASVSPSWRFFADRLTQRVAELRRKSARST